MKSAEQLVPGKEYRFSRRKSPKLKFIGRLDNVLLFFQGEGVVTFNYARLAKKKMFYVADTVPRP